MADLIVELIGAIFEAIFSALPWKITVAFIVVILIAIIGILMWTQHEQSSRSNRLSRDWEAAQRLDSGTVGSKEF